MKRDRLVLLSAVLLTGCAKDELPDTAPAIGMYRTYDLVTSLVKADVNGGFVLMCKGSPIEQRNRSLEFMDANGDRNGHIDLDALPTTIGGVSFDPDEVLYTDFAILADGTFDVVGLAREVAVNDRLHLIIHHISRNGSAIATARRYFITDSAVVAVNDNGAGQDLDGLPRERVLCEPLNDGSLVLAARWETATSAGVRLLRLPPLGSADASGDLALMLAEPNDRLHALSCDPNSGRTILLTDHGDPGSDHHIEVQGFTISPSAGWIPETGSLLTASNAEPQQLQWHEGAFFLGGYAPTGNGYVVKPFLCRFTTAAEADGSLHVLGDIAVSDRPVTSYCSTWWNGALQMVVQVHEASALPPYFNGDITSDLAVTKINNDLLADSTNVQIPGQGLRAIACFTSNGRRVIIGSQHPFLNAGYIHTFYLELE